MALSEIIWNYWLNLDKDSEKCILFDQTKKIGSINTFSLYVFGLEV